MLDGADRFISGPQAESIPQEGGNDREEITYQTMLLFLESQLMLIFT